MVNGVAQGESVRILNIITEKDEVQNLTLDDSVKYLPFASTSDRTGTALDGLFSTSNPTRNVSMTQNKNVGTFVYTGSADFYGKPIQVGDTVALYEGTVPNQRNAINKTRAAQIGNEGAVAYVQITAYDEATNTYTYHTADTEDVLFTPDILPFDIDDDQDDVDNQITVDTAKLDFSAASYQTMGLNLNADTVVERNDYVALYKEWESGQVTYGCITEVTNNGDTTVIKYTTVDDVSEILASMDIYASRNEDLQDELTPELKEQIKQDIITQAVESGFMDEAAEYLTALAFETDGFQELSEDLDMDLSAYTITFDDGTPVDPESMDLMGLTASIDEKKVDVNVTAGDLVHFKDGEGDDALPLQGLRVELVLSFSVSIKSGDTEKMKISMQAVFEQELLLSINVSGGAIWKYAWIIPYLYDYNMNANLDVGTYTGIGITATAQTVGEKDEDGDNKDEGNSGESEGGSSDKPAEGGDDNKNDDDNKSEGSENPLDDFDWHKLVDVTSTKLTEIDETIGKAKSAKDRIMNIGDEIKELMESEQELFRLPNKTFVGSVESAGSVEFKSLEERYADMMKEAEEAWIDIFRVEIFKSEGHVDPFHILCYGIDAEFVVSANLYVTMGMTFEYGVAKRYNFSLMLFHGTVTNETIDLETEHYQFDFYVMGTAGIRAGIEFEIAMGLFSLELDSVGISAEVGAYAQPWGYFYYHLEWQRGQAKQSTCSGALAIEVGAYLSIKFKAQLLSMDKLTYNPTWYENEWPFLTVGSIENVKDFNYGESDEMLSVTMENVQAVQLPTELFDMTYMDMKTGKIHGGEEDDKPINYDDEEESRFIIELSNPKFKYFPDMNMIAIVDVDPETETYETCEMTITWGGAPLAFTSDSISRTVEIEWINPAGIRTITFLSDGGTPVPAIAIGFNEEIPDSAYAGDPTRQGFEFLGWFDYDTGAPFEIPEIMPDYPVNGKWGRGVAAYAKWGAKNDTPYTVNHYVENVNGVFELEETETLKGTTMQYPTKAAIEAAAEQYDNDYYYLGAYQNYPIAPDGSTVIDLYYKRETFTITFEFGDVLKKLPIYNEKRRVCPPCQNNRKPVHFQSML